jgi:hypothetical protein
MHLPTALTIMTAGLALASPLARRDNDGLSPICTHLKTKDHGCIRYVRGFDVTGVVTEVDLTFPEIQNECDCIQQCLDRATTCAAWVYKFSTPASVKSDHRTCTLYSQFNLPSQVTIEVDLNSNLNRNINANEIKQMGNNPQAGSLVPQAFKDINLDTTPDNNAFSGYVHLSVLFPSGYHANVLL